MMILCRCVLGISGTKLKEKLLQKPEITLVRAIDLLRASQVTNVQLASLSASKSVVVGLVEKTTTPTPAPRKISTCKFCGYDQIRGKCPAYGQKGRRCGRKNHFRKVCSSSRKEVNTVCMHNEDPDMNQLFVGIVGDENCDVSWSKNYQVKQGDRNKSDKFKFNTGAQANILPSDIAEAFGAIIEPSNARLVSYSRQRIDNYGVTIPAIEDEKMAESITFKLVDEGSCPVFGALPVLS